MKKIFVALLLFGILVISSSAGYNSVLAKRLVFLNFPEKVEESGKLGKQTINEPSNTRIFFHYLNATGREQVFNFKLKGNFKDFRSAVETNKEPGIAGSKAIKSFLNAKAKSVSNPQVIKEVADGDTVSGLIEAKMDKGNSWFCRLGAGEEVEGIKIINVDDFDRDIQAELKDNKPFEFRLGDNRKDIIPGHYGYNYNFSIKNTSDKDKMLLCFINSRAGKMTAVFKVGEEDVVSTGEIQPKQDVKFHNQLIRPNETLNFQYLPTGGYSYPIELKFKTIDY